MKEIEGGRGERTEQEAEVERKEDEERDGGVRKEGEVSGGYYDQSNQYKKKPSTVN